MAINQISVFLENKPGQLAEFPRLLEQNQIDMPSPKRRISAFCA